MNLSLPICCNKAAYDAVAKLVPDMDGPGSLVAGAVAIARLQLPEADVQVVQGQLAVMANLVASRVRGDQPQALVAHLHEYLFEELHYIGNSEDYYNPCNSLLPWVLEHHTGLPITLSLVYRLVAEQLGLKVWGVGLPGHFLVGVDLDGKSAWIDPFAGGKLITPAEAKVRMANQFGQHVEWTDHLPDPVNNRYWLTRILQNLLTAYSRRAQYTEVASVLEMELSLWPEETRLQRDLALVLARMGMGDVASAWLDYYLQNNPNDPQQSDLRQLLASLG